MVKFQNKETLSLSRREAKGFNDYLKKYHGAQLCIDFKRKQQIRSVKIPLKKKNRILHIRQSSCDKKICLYGHTEKSTLGHFKDAINEQDVHFGIGSKLVHDYYTYFQSYKSSLSAKKGWKTRKRNEEQRRREYQMKNRKSRITYRKKSGKKRHSILIK